MNLFNARASLLDKPPSSSEEDKSDYPHYHEITSYVIVDPASGDKSFVIEQTDVTNRVVMEDLLIEMSEGQLEMLSEIFPRHVIEFLSLHGLTCSPELIGSLARNHRDVTVLFMDIVGFTAMANEVEPEAVMVLLNQLFTIFDTLCDIYGVQKVETAGDCYIAASGIMKGCIDGFSVVDPNEKTHQPSHSTHSPVLGAQRIMTLAKAMIAAAKTIVMPHNGESLSIRVGIHTGPCVSGLVGNKLPKFSIFGDIMNTASRMESTSIPGHIQVSEATWSLLRSCEKFKPTGGVLIKGKGVMSTFIWEPTSIGDVESIAEEESEHMFAKSTDRRAASKTIATTSKELSFSQMDANTMANEKRHSSSIVIPAAMSAAMAAGGEPSKEVVHRRKPKAAFSTSYLLSRTMANTAAVDSPIQDRSCSNLDSDNVMQIDPNLITICKSSIAWMNISHQQHN